MVSNAFDNSMDTTATVSLLLRQCLQSSVSLINDVSQLQLYVDEYTVYAEMKSNIYIEFAHLKRQEHLEDCYLVLAAQSLLCNAPSWTCHVVMF